MFISLQSQEADIVADSIAADSFRQRHDLQKREYITHLNIMKQHIIHTV